MKSSSSTSGLPRRVLRLALPLGLALAGCDSPPTPPPANTATPTTTAPPATSAAAVAPTTTATAAPTTTAAAQPEREVAGAAHILIAYKGAKDAPKTVTRSQEEAKKRAEEVLKKLKDGKSFEELVKEYSDDTTSKASNGMLGNFERNVMPPAFSDATFKLEVGGISDVVETPKGFHIIKRTK